MDNTDRVKLKGIKRGRLNGNLFKNLEMQSSAQLIDGIKIRLEAGWNFRFRYMAYNKLRSLE